VKVILLEPLENLGDVGQVVNVKPGYAKNYLLPRGLAVLATESNLKALEAKIRAQAKRLAERKAEAERLKEILENLTLTIPVRAGENKIYGSVTAKDIAEALSRQHGITIDPKRLRPGEAHQGAGGVRPHLQTPPRGAHQPQGERGGPVTPSRQAARGGGDPALFAGPALGVCLEAWSLSWKT
jgi:large subunit ribosomal protein L9